MNSDASTLAAHLRAARERSSQVTGDLQGDRLLGPKLQIVNPPLWEIGHVGWFQEYWCLRHRGADAPLDSILPGADALYDSAKVAHDTRWDLPLPSLAATRSYLSDVLALALRRLEREPENADLLYFAQLAAFHEDMHVEAFHYTRQTLGYADPFIRAEAAPAPAGASGDVALDGGALMLGATPGDGFVFDNEKWAHEVKVAPFRIARTAVTNDEYSGFVDAGGYLRREYWSEEGWAWRAQSGLQAPRYWSKPEGSWRMRRFDAVVPLRAEAPVMHVNWHEAQAYCRFAERRLPSEAEWEFAASTCAWGEVWEWTASPFEPYPGFAPDPYKEYSQPWFGTHKVLRGGSFTTPRRLMRNTFRNFYTPDRGDIFAGFRTCAED